MQAPIVALARSGWSIRFLIHEISSRQTLELETLVDRLASLPMKAKKRLNYRLELIEGRLRVNPKATEHYQAGHCYFFYFRGGIAGAGAVGAGRRGTGAFVGCKIEL